MSQSMKIFFHAAAIICGGILMADILKMLIGLIIDIIKRSWK